MSRQICVVGGTHGNNEGIVQILKNILAGSLPAYLIFLGDIFGSSTLNKLRQIFNSFITHTRQHLQDQPYASEAELFWHDFGSGLTLGTLIRQMEEIIHSISKCKETVFDRKDCFHELINYAHFEHFISNLPSGILLYLQSALLANINDLMKLINEFINQGTRVVFLEGSNEYCTPFDFYPIPNCLHPIRENDRPIQISHILPSNVLFATKGMDLLDKDLILSCEPYFHFSNGTVDESKVSSYTEENTRKIILLTSPPSSMTLSPKDIETAESNLKTIIGILNPQAIISGTNLDGQFYNYYSPISTHIISNGTCQVFETSDL